MVSVIIPAFNCENTISKTILSALHQTVASLEVIVIDDASTDQTYHLVEQISSTEHRIRLYKNPKNCGVAKTRNIGCRYAHGKYIAFLDSDDIWQADKLEKQLQELKRTQSDFSYSSYYIISESAARKKLYKVPASTSYSQLLKENVIGCSTVLIRTDLMKEYKFSPDFFHEDYALWLTLLREGYRAVGIEEAMVFYRKGGRSSNKFKAAKNRWIIYRQLEKLSFFSSIYYLSCYFFASIRKYI